MPKQQTRHRVFARQIKEPAKGLTGWSGDDRHPRFGLENPLENGLWRREQVPAIVASEAVGLFGHTVTEAGNCTVGRVPVAAF